MQSDLVSPRSNLPHDPLHHTSRLAILLVNVDEKGGVESAGVELVEDAEYAELRPTPSPVIRIGRSK